MFTVHPKYKSNQSHRNNGIVGMMHHVSFYDNQTIHTMDVSVCFTFFYEEEEEEDEKNE